MDVQPAPPATVPPAPQPQVFSCLTHKDTQKKIGKLKDKYYIQFRCSNGVFLRLAFARPVKESYGNK